MIGSDETRAARRLALAIRDHEIGATERARFRAVVERSRFLLPHDSSPTIPPAALPAPESEQGRMTRYWICNRDGNGPTADHANDDDARAWSSDYPTDAFTLYRHGGTGWREVAR